MTFKGRMVWGEDWPHGIKSGEQWSQGRFGADGHPAHSHTSSLPPSTLAEFLAKWARGEQTLMHRDIILSRRLLDESLALAGLNPTALADPAGLGRLRFHTPNSPDQAVALRDELREAGVHVALWLTWQSETPAEV